MKFRFVNNQGSRFGLIHQLSQLNCFHGPNWPCQKTRSSLRIQSLQKTWKTKIMRGSIRRWYSDLGWGDHWELTKSTKTKSTIAKALAEKEQSLTVKKPISNIVNNKIKKIFTHTIELSILSILTVYSGWWPMHFSYAYIDGGFGFVTWWGGLKLDRRGAV